MINNIKNLKKIEEYEIKKLIEKKLNYKDKHIKENLKIILNVEWIDELKNVLIKNINYFSNYKMITKLASDIFMMYVGRKLVNYSYKYLNNPNY
jgi:hypothetical protein